jgi:hypothetical protein
MKSSVPEYIPPGRGANSYHRQQQNQNNEGDSSNYDLQRASIINRREKPKAELLIEPERPSEPIYQTDIRRNHSSTNTEKDLGDKPQDKQGGLKSKFYVSELDYHIPDLNVTHYSSDQGSVKSCGTDGCTVTTGTTVQVSNGITAKLRRVFKRKKSKSNEKHENLPMSITTAEVANHDNMQANPLVEETPQGLISQRLSRGSDGKSDNVRNDGEDDIRDTSQPQQKRNFTLSFIQNIFECCTTDEDIFLE